MDKKMKPKCWWCVTDITKHTFHIPISIENQVFRVIGYFCSLNCCLSYILKSVNIKNQTLSISLLYKLYNKFIVTNNIKDIVPSPPRETLRIFGGDLTYEEYDKIKISNNVIINLMFFPGIPLEPPLAQIVISKFILIEYV